MAAHAFAINRAISPWMEMGAYEALWTQEGTTFTRLAARFKDHPGALPSYFFAFDRDVAQEYAEKTDAILSGAGVRKYGVRIHGAGEYPEKLRDADSPVELLYYQGFWDLAYTRGIAVVGTRKPSPEGVKRAEKLTRMLCSDGFTIVSGLAAGIDAIAHKTAIASGAPTIGVIGTPLSSVYPKENTELQSEIARNHLLISQVPVCRYSSQDWRVNRGFFPERNITMSALTEATIIVEAGDTSGTLIQARHALKQRRKLFILDSCFEQGLEWPDQYAAKGAIRVKDFEEIRVALDKGGKRAKTNSSS